MFRILRRNFLPPRFRVRHCRLRHCETKDRKFVSRRKCYVGSSSLDDFGSDDNVRTFWLLLRSESNFSSTHTVTDNIDTYDLQCGACVIRKQRAGREASEKNRPSPDEEYGSKLRGDALAAHERDKAYLAQNTQREGVLPAFAQHERDNEDLPLNSLQATAFDDDGYQPRHYPPPPRHMSAATGVGAPSLISGVGEGYGRRNNGPPGMPVSLTPESSYSNLPPPAPTGTPNNAGRGAGTGSRLASDARAQRGYASTEPFQGMHDGAPPLSSASPPPMSNQGHYQSSSAYGHNDPNLLSTSTPVPMPVPQTVSFDDPHQTQPISPTYHAVSPTNQGGYPAYPPAPPAALMPGGGNFGGGGGKQQQYGQTSMPEPQLQQPQQNFYVQNPSPSTHQTDPSISSHYNDQGLNPNHTGGGIDRAPSTHAPTYYTYDDQYQSQQPQGGSVNYHAPQQQQGSYGDQYGYENSRGY